MSRHVTKIAGCYTEIVILCFYSIVSAFTSPNNALFCLTVLKISLFVVTTSKIHINHVMLKFFVVFACFPTQSGYNSANNNDHGTELNLSGRFRETKDYFSDIALSDSEIVKFHQAILQGIDWKPY